jgi:hypothetical protein
VDPMLEQVPIPEREHSPERGPLTMRVS